MTTRAFLLDIEGTTTPISFVHDVLFPYARQRFHTFLQEHTDLDEDLRNLQEEHAEDIGIGNEPAPLVEPYIYWLMDRDRKSPALKSLQGKIWEDGYRSGSLLSTVFDDVPRAFERWLGDGLTISIFSSGSVLAQQLLFRFTNVGDLTSHISQYFDTTIGKKADSLSYQKIANSLQLGGEEVHFVSDVIAELDAAAATGMTTSLSVRPGNPPHDMTTRHQVINSFDQL